MNRPITRQSTAIGGALLLLSAVSLSADVVTDWSTTAQTAMVATAMKFPLQTRTLAIMHAAMFDAVNSVEHRYEPYAVNLSAPAANEEAAAASAAHSVLTALLPSQQPALNAAYAASLAAIPNGQAKTDGIILGQLVAAAMLSLRANDGSNITAVYVPGGGPGAWIPTAPTFGPAVWFGWGETPFAINSGTQFRPDGPPALTGDQYTADFIEVKTLGQNTSTVRTLDQTNAALFWVEFPNYTWNAMARQAVAAKNIGLLDSARLFALLNMASADSIMSGFKAKYIYAFWRPVTAIQNADTDGNDATVADPSWQPLNAPPEHPDYPSNHSVYSGAAAEVLGLLLGDDFDFTIASSSSPFPRSFTSFTGAAQECGLSRIWLGFHFHSAVRDGLNLGKQIGHFAVNHNLTLVHGDRH
jgi:hypothetical protein